MSKVIFLTHQANRTGAPLFLDSILSNRENSLPKIDACIVTITGGPLLTNFKKYCKVFNLHWHKKGFFSIVTLFHVGRLFLYLLCSSLFIKKFDYIYANSIATLRLAIKLKKVFNIPIILHVHEAYFLMKVFGIRKEELDMCKSFITVSNFAYKNLVDNYGVLPEKIQVIPPYDIKKITSLDFTNNKKDNDTFIVGISGKADWIKGSDLLPIVIKNVVDKCNRNSIKFLLVGYYDPEELNKFNYDISRLKLQNYIEFAGQVSNPYEYYSRMDALLILSREESFSMVAVELALMAKPIVCFSNTIGLETMLPSNSFLTSDYLDLNGITNNILHLMSDNNYCQEIGLTCKKQVKSFFEKTSKISSHYEDLLNYGKI